MTRFPNNAISFAEIHPSTFNSPKISNTNTSRNPYIPLEKEVRSVDIKELARPDTEKKNCNFDLQFSNIQKKEILEKHDIHLKTF